MRKAYNRRNHAEKGEMVLIRCIFKTNHRQRKFKHKGKHNTEGI